MDRQRPHSARRVPLGGFAKIGMQKKMRMWPLCQEILVGLLILVKHRNLFILSHLGMRAVILVVQYLSEPFRGAAAPGQGADQGRRRLG
jgi:hypothetical protein